MSDRLSQRLLRGADLTLATTPPVHDGLRRNPGAGPARSAAEADPDGRPAGDDIERGVVDTQTA